MAGGAAPAAGGGAQRTVMLDVGSTPPPPARLPSGGARSLAPLQQHAPPSTWQRWAIGPGVMVGTALVTFLLSGVLLPAKAIEQKPPKPKEIVYGKIELKTTPSGATVVIDGKSHPHFTPTELKGEVDATAHIVLTLAGYKPHEGDVIFHNDTRPLAISLDQVDEKPVERPKRQPKVDHVAEAPREKVAKPAGKGSISIFVHPWAIVFVDGTRLRQTPIANYELSPGRHTFTLQNEGLGKKESVSVNVKPGPNSEIRREWAK